MYEYVALYHAALNITFNIPWLRVTKSQIRTLLDAVHFLHASYNNIHIVFLQLIPLNTLNKSRSKWPCVLRSSSATDRLLRLWVRIPPGAWMSVLCDCCVLSGRGLSNELISPPEDSYRLWCVVECDLETSWIRRPGPIGGFHGKENMRVMKM